MNVNFAVWPHAVAGQTEANVWKRYKSWKIKNIYINISVGNPMLSLSLEGDRFESLGGIGDIGR